MPVLTIPALCPQGSTFAIREPDLVAAYERHLAHLAPAVTNSPHPSLSPELIETIAKSKLQDREADQWVVFLGGKSVKVREPGDVFTNTADGIYDDDDDTTKKVYRNTLRGP